DAPRIFRRPWAGRVREVSKTVELPPVVGAPADARADRIKTPLVVVSLGEGEDSAARMAAAARGNTAPGPAAGGGEEARPSADVEARPTADAEGRASADVEARPSEGARSRSAVRSFLAPVVVGLVASVLATVLTAQQLGGRDDGPQAVASAMPTMMHAATRAP